MKDISISYEQEYLKAKAQKLADQLAISLDKDAESCLLVTEEKLALKLPGFSLLWSDFSAAFWKKRRTEGKKQGLVRACKPTSGMSIVDATAGWGRDAAILASFGAQVLMIERHPIMGALLADALSFQSSSDRQEINLSLYQGDALSYLKSLSEEGYPDIIYMDPMHPERNKSALVKKDMQVLQQLIGPDDDALELIELARTRVKKRVVVKWPQKIKPLLGTSSSVEGKTVRFDIYGKV